MTAPIRLLCCHQPTAEPLLLCDTPYVSTVVVCWRGVGRLGGTLLTIFLAVLLQVAAELRSVLIGDQTTKAAAVQKMQR